MPVYHSIRIAWFNRETRLSGAEDWVLKMHLAHLKRRAMRLNRLHPIIMHWVEEKSMDHSEAVNLGSNPYQDMSASSTELPPPPDAFATPPQPAYPPPFPLHNNITQHLYGDP